MELCIRKYNDKTGYGTRTNAELTTLSLSNVDMKYEDGENAHKHVLTRNRKNRQRGGHIKRGVLKG